MAQTLLRILEIVLRVFAVKRTVKNRLSRIGRVRERITRPYSLVSWVCASDDPRRVFA